MIDMNYRFKKNGQIIYKELEGAPVLVDPYRRMLIRLNETGSEIWSLLDGKISAADIVRSLGDKFDVDEKSLKADIIRFLDDMVKREMVL